MSNVIKYRQLFFRLVNSASSDDLTVQIKELTVSSKTLVFPFKREGQGCRCKTGFCCFWEKKSTVSERVHISSKSKAMVD